MSNDGLSQEGLKAIAGIFTAIACGLTIGRFFVSTRKRRSALDATSWADYLNAAAAVFLIGFIATQFYYLPLNYAVQLWARRLPGPPITRDDVVTFYKVEFAQFMVFWIVLYLVKASFLALYRGLFRISKPFRAAWWGVVALTTIAFLIDFLGALWICGPPSGLFDPHACASRDAMVMGRNMIIMGSVVNIVSDVACMALPLAMLRSLKVTRAQKVALAGVFTLALVDIVCDIIRTVATFTATINTAFNVLEPTIAVIICALPVYRSYVQGLATSNASARWRSWFSSIRSKSSRGGSSGGSSGLRSMEKKLPAMGQRAALGSAGSFGSSTTAGALSVCPSCGRGMAMARPGSPVPPPLEKDDKHIVVKRDLESATSTDEALNYGIYYHAEATGPRETV